MQEIVNAKELYVHELCDTLQTPTPTARLAVEQLLQVEKQRTGVSRANFKLYNMHIYSHKSLL
jgi:hypothetical protein